MGGGSPARVESECWKVWQESSPWHTGTSTATYWTWLFGEYVAILSFNHDHLFVKQATLSLGEHTSPAASHQQWRLGRGAGVHMAVVTEGPK